MNKIKVSAVAYTNTLPFIYGITRSEVSDEIEMSRDVPSECARKLIHHEADLGILPVGALHDVRDYHIVSDYCIGADGAVDSVFIFSDKPIDEIQTLRLDAQSRTSNTLAQVLLRYHWKHDVLLLTAGEADAYVEIGDRTFGKKERYPHYYDLAKEWKDFTGLPFVFAVWVANKKLEAGFLERFNEALAYGVTHRKEVAEALPKRADFDYVKYLSENIDFRFDEQKKIAVSDFLALRAEIYKYQ